MESIHRNIAGFGALCAVLVVVAACSPERVPPPTVDELMHDRVALDGILMKCGTDPKSVGLGVNCDYARIAIARLAAQRDAAEAAKREAEFEQRRAALRQVDERQRQQQEAAQKVDPYTLPLEPTEPASATPPQGATATQKTGSQPTIVGQTQQ